jgi:hypothetical protein
MAMIRCSKGHFYNDQEHALCPWCGAPAAGESPASAIKEPLRSVVGKIGDACDSFAGKDDNQQAPGPKPTGKKRQPSPDSAAAYPPAAAPQSPNEQPGWKDGMAEDSSHTISWDAARSEALKQPLAMKAEADVSRDSIPPEVETPEEPDGGHTIALIKKKMGIDPVVGWLVCVEGVEKGRDYRLHSEKNWIGRSESMDIIIKDPAISRENHAAVVYDPRKETFDIRPGEVRGMVYVNGEEAAKSLNLSPYDRIELGDSKFLFIPFVGGDFNWREKSDGEGK